MQSLQTSSLRELEESLKDLSVTLTVQYSDTLHDREVKYMHVLSMHNEYNIGHDRVFFIRFSNGWIVRLGRGLDYFQRPKVSTFEVC